jgi:signal transduction histidine kinase
MASISESFSRIRQGLLLGIAFVLLIVIAGMIAWLVEQSTSDAALVAHTLQVQNTLSELLLNVRRAESGQRGYLFTNQQHYLDDFNEAAPEVEQQLQELHDLVLDNPARLAEAARLKELTDAKFVEMRRTIELNQSGQREDARALVLGGAGRDLAAEIRKLTDGAIADEARLFNERSNRSRLNSQTLLAISLVGTLLIVVIGGFSIYLVQRNYRQRELAQRELESTNANLESIVEYRTADLQEANEEIQRFAYIVSHDLRSPLVNIMGFTTELEMLRKDIFERVAKLQEDITRLQAPVEPAAADAVNDLGKDFDEAIGIIKTSIERMDRLINAVLKLSREGRRQFNPEQIDMAAMMKSIVDSVAHRAAESGTQIEIGDVSPVESDRLALEQIFSNLIDNALKYGRPDGGHIEINGRATATQAIYEVRDNGRGIDPKDHQRVFELFRRSGVQDRPGEGLGLAHVRALVRRLGGHIGLSSELGKGSQFTVTLPRRWMQDKTRRSAA